MNGIGMPFVYGNKALGNAFLFILEFIWLLFYYR